VIGYGLMGYEITHNLSHIGSVTFLGESIATASAKFRPGISIGPTTNVSDPFFWLQ
jgi:hypothetical protein